MDDKKIKVLIKESTYNKLKQFYDTVYIPSLAKMNAEEQKKTREILGDTFDEFVDGFLLQNVEGVIKTNEFMSKMPDMGGMKEIFGNLGLGDINDPAELMKKLSEIVNPFGTTDEPVKKEEKKPEEKKDLKN